MTIKPSDVKPFTFDAPTGTEFYDLIADRMWGATTDETRKAIAKCLPKIYERDARELREVLKKIKTININNYKDFEDSKEIKFADKFYFAYRDMFHRSGKHENSPFDPQNLVPIAEEIFYLSKFIEDAKLITKVSSSWDAERKDGWVQRAIERIEKWQKNGKCGLDKFYADAKNLMLGKSSEISKSLQEHERSSAISAKIQKEIDNRPVPSYELRDFKSNTKSDDVVKMWSVEFSDGLRGLVYYHVQGRLNWYSHNNWDSNRYKTLDDAIKAYYVSKKFHQDRSIGLGVNRR